MMSLFEFFNGALASTFPHLNQEEKAKRRFNLKRQTPTGKRVGAARSRDSDGDRWEASCFPSEKWANPFILNKVKGLI